MCLVQNILGKNNQRKYKGIEKNHASQPEAIERFSVHNGHVRVFHHLIHNKCFLRTSKGIGNDPCKTFFKIIF